MSVFAGVAAAAPALGASAAASYSSADEVRAIVSEMLADAETRASLQGGGAMAGHDGHFFLSDAGGNFRLQIDGSVQFRYTLNFRDGDGDDDPEDVDGDGDLDPNPDLDDDFESGFTTPRTELAFSGNLAAPNLLYKVSGAFDRDGGEFRLEDAWAAYAWENGLILLFGQYKMPVLWEDVINNRNSLAADQSVVNAVFRQDRSQGAWLHHPTEHFRWWAGFSDGIRSENTDFDDDGSDWALTGRIEWKWAGEWSAFDQFTSMPGSEHAGRLSAATHWQDQSSGDDDLLLGAATTEVFVKGSGWNAYAMGVWLHTDDDTDEFDDFGAMVQGGFYIPGADKWEPFARYDVVIPDGDRTNDDAFNTIAAGVNYYLFGTAAKFTFDVQYFLDATIDNDLVASVATGESGSRGTRIGLLPSDDASFAVRFQFQIVF
jgi:hypothetical protein